jgi:hypothetical protein
MRLRPYIKEWDIPTLHKTRFPTKVSNIGCQGRWVKRFSCQASANLLVIRQSETETMNVCRLTGTQTRELWN